MNKKVLWITETAVLIALLVVVQFVTKSFGQLVTGSCVNLLLAVAAIVGGLWCGATVAAISPFLAWMLGIGPSVIQIVPMIAIGNIVFVVLIYFLVGKLMKDMSFKSYALGVLGTAISAFVKFGVLWLLIVKLMLPMLTLAEKQVSMMSAMFAWPQLFTALIGGGIALIVAPVLRKALKR